MFNIFTAVFVAACACAYGRPLEGGGVMFAAKQIFLARGGKGWQNPYVADGLIAMWDGEWNSGPGVHDASATIWKDLSGNGIDAPLSTTPYAIRQNAVVFRGKQCSFQNNLATTVMHLEVVAQRTVKFNNPSTRLIAQVGCGVYWRGSEGTNQGGPVLCALYNLRTNKGPGYGVPNVETVSSPVAVSYSSVFDNYNDQYGPSPYANGVQVSKWFIGSYWGPPSATIMFGNTSTADGETIIYCTRAYNRILSAAEIAANYAIDKARFNLP